MNPKSKYILQPTEKSFCPKCHANVWMLCEENFEGVAFYICFDCKYIGEVGKGPVKRVR